MSDAGVSYAVADGIACFTLNRPPVNALTLDMIRSLVAALRRAAADDAARAVVLASAVPQRFCAGLDLGMLLGTTGDDVRAFLQTLYVDLSDAHIISASPRSRWSVAPRAVAA